ncbi:MAG: LPS-assembly protein LptD [Pseudomonadales bacterium]
MTRLYRHRRAVARFLATCILLTGAFGLGGPAMAAEPQGLAWEYWQPRDALDPAQRSGLSPFCAGRYLWPVFPLPTSATDEDYPVEAEARELTYFESGEVTLQGDVVVRQGNRILRSEEVGLNHETRQGSIATTVQIEQPDAILRGTDAAMNLDTKATVINGAEFLLVQPEFRGTAGRLERYDNGDLEVTGGSFTRCEPTNNNWRVGARSLRIREGSDVGVARDAVVRVKGVPVFYTPYLSFPTSDERKSGWLFPNLGFSSQNGFEFAPPYYLNLAPNYDATVVPRYFQKRGLGIEGELRYLSGWQESRVVGSFLPDDSLYDGTYEKDDFEDLEAAGLVEGPFESEDRWLYGLYHEGNAKAWHTTVDYTAVSDRDYFRNLDTEINVASDRELERFGEIQYLRNGLDLRLWAQGFQRLDDVQVDAYRRLPELSLSYLGDLPGPLEWSIGAAGAMFDRDNEDLVGVARIVGNRVHVEPRVSLPLTRPWGFLNLTGGYRYTAYDLEDTAPDVDETPVRKIGLGSVDTGLFFEKDFDLFGRRTVHTLEPRVYYLYQQYQDQDDFPRFDATQLTFRYDQLWRDNRFSGLDRIGDANQLSMGFTSRLLNASSGVEMLRASIGQIRYFEDRRVTLFGVQTERDQSSKSEFAGELAARMRSWTVGADVIWDPTLDKVSRGGGYTTYRASNDRIVHLGYRYDTNFIDQTDVAVIWPLTRRYAAIGRWNYDLNTRRTIEGLAGIEYNDCCWKLRVVYRSYLDSPSARDFESAEKRSGIYFQVVFKGLASLDDSLESLLSKSIRGYVMEDEWTR